MRLSRLSLIADVIPAVEWNALVDAKPTSTHLPSRTWQRSAGSEKAAFRILLGMARA